MTTSHSSTDTRSESAHKQRSHTQQRTHAQRSHSSCVRDSSAYSTVCIRNKIVLLTEHTTNSATKLYVLVFNGLTLTLDSAIAECVHSACMRHVVRVTKDKVSMRNSVSTMRSDIRALVREVAMNQYAH